MRCTCYRTDPPTLVAALTDGDLLARYQAWLGEEVKSLGDRSLLAHLKRLSTYASRAQAHGFDLLARNDLQAADELLTDLLAVATWNRWDLPLEEHGEQDLPVDDLPRGILGADQSPENARVWLLDGTTIALARSREAGEVIAGPAGG